MEGSLLNIKVNYATSSEFLSSTTKNKGKRFDASLGPHLVTGSQLEGLSLTTVLP